MSALPNPRSHVCAVRVACASDMPPQLVPSDWCFSAFRPMIAALGAAGVSGRPAKLCLWSEDGVEVYYAPFDWANEGARIVLVGITPGGFQMQRALSVAADLAASEMPDDEVLAACKASASFSGPMRDLLVGMLDDIGVPAGLAIGSTASLWDSDQQLASFTSTVCYPVFVDGENYSGESPRIDRVPLLREFAGRILAADLALTPDALIVPLGKRPSEWVSRLVRTGQVDGGRCLLGMPHPSPANGHRARQFAERRDDLRRQVATFFADQH
jgi:hypothetical protein